MKNNSYPSWLVSLEIAKELKEIGFNEPCLVENVETHSEDYYFINFEEEMCSDVSIMLEDVIFVKNQFLEDELGIYKHFVLKTAIPTWEQVFQWFREKKIYGNVNQEWEYGRYNSPKRLNYFYVINDCRKKDINKTEAIVNGGFDNYEEAREELVIKLIQTYKSEQL